MPQHKQNTPLIGRVTDFCLESYLNKFFPHGDATFREALEHGCNSEDSYFSLGIYLEGLGRLEDAEQAFRQAIEFRPDFSEALGKLADILMQLGRPEAAEEICRQAIALAPDSAEAYTNLGKALIELDRIQEAVHVCKQAIELDPACANAYNILGNALREVGQFGPSGLTYLIALAIDPDFAEASCNLGITLKYAGCMKESEDACHKALQLRPGYAEVYENLGDVLKNLGRTEEAEEAYRNALTLKPSLYGCRIKLAMMGLPVIAQSTEQSREVPNTFCAALDELESSIAEDKWADFGKAVGTVNPFYLAYRPGNHTSLLARYGTMMCHARKAWQDTTSCSSEQIPHRKRVRLVIVTGHARRHSIWDVMLHGLLRHLDRNRFEVFLYHTSTVLDSVTADAHALVDRFVQGPANWLKQICDDQPDVIFYPEITMDPATYKLATLRLAPVQATSWGHPITSGLPSIDLFFSGELLERDDADADYCEKLVRLPGTGCCTIPLPITPEYPDPAVLASAQDSHVINYLICQQVIKFDPSFDEIYPRIARASSRACRFWFVRDVLFPWASDRVEKRIAAAFETEGLNPADYIQFIDWLPREQFLWLLDLMDIYLDTPAFSGYTTVWQALQRGMPVVTLEGKYLRQRLAAGLLRRMGITETIAVDTADFVRKAVALADNPAGLAELRERLRAEAVQIDEDIRVVRAFESTLLDELAGR